MVSVQRHIVRQENSSCTQTCDIHYQLFSVFKSSAPFGGSAWLQTDCTSSTPQGSPAMPCCHFSVLHRCPPAPTATHPKSPETHVRCLPNRFVWEKHHRSAHAGKRGNARCFLLCQCAFLAGSLSVGGRHGRIRQAILTLRACTENQIEYGFSKTNLRRTRGIEGRKKLSEAHHTFLIAQHHT